MASLSDRADLLTSANFIRYAVGFTLPMLIVRLLSKSDCGTYQQLLLLNSMAVGLLTLGLPNSIYYFYNRIASQQQSVLVFQALMMFNSHPWQALCGRSRLKPDTCPMESAESRATGVCRH
jgi:O-antigen/teichoic acid export membrane protein